MSARGVPAQVLPLLTGQVLPPPVNWSGTPPSCELVRYSPCGQTDACKLITLPQTSFGAVIIGEVEVDAPVWEILDPPLVYSTCLIKVLHH